MHCAISSIHHEVCEYLIENGANVYLTRNTKLVLHNEAVLHGNLIENPDENEKCDNPLDTKRSISILGASTENSRLKSKCFTILDEQAPGSKSYLQI